MKNYKWYFFWALFLPIQWVVVQILSNYPNFVERFYSTGIYPITSSVSRFLLGWIPFSIGDLLYFFIVIVLIKSIVKIIRKRKIRIIRLIANLSFVYFAFHLLWGLNYLRQPIQKTFQISTVNYTTEELNIFTNNLIDTINNVHFSITKNDTLKVTIPLSKKEIYSKVKNGYDILKVDNPIVSIKNASIKHSIISLPLSYMGFAGYLNPFTGEAQVNSLNPLISYPATSCHEVAHQLGFAAENEANFIGFLAAINNDDIYFQYSGYYLALRYALNDLYRHDKILYKTTFEKLNKGIVKNMQESYTHWNQFKNPLEPLFKSVFNQYLKANKQPEGIKTYNFMVGLLINYEKKHIL